MNQEERLEYVQFRLESAYQTYNAAKSLFKNEMTEMKKAQQVTMYKRNEG